MYKVQPSDAMTEMYGINKADAQVFDNRQLQERLYKKADEHLANKKAKDAEQKGLMVEIGKLGKGAIRPSDLDYFGNGQKAIYDKVKKYYAEAKGGDLSIDQQVEIEGDIVKLQTEANVSAQLSAENTANANKYNASPTKYRKSSLDATIDNQFNTKNGGNFAARGQLQEYIDLDEIVNSKLAPQAMNQAKMVDDRGYYSNTSEDREKLVDSMFANKDYADQAELNYAEIPESDRKGTTNAREFYGKEWDQRLTVSHKPPLSERDKYGSGDKDKVDTRVTRSDNEDGSMDWHMTNPTTNEEMIITTKDGKVINGTQGTKLTAEEKALQDDMRKINLKMEQEYNEKVAAVKAKATKMDVSGSWGVTTGSANDNLKEAIKKREKYIQDNLPEKPKYKAIPYAEKGINVDGVRAQEVGFDKFKVNINKLMAGGQEGVEVQDATKGPAKPVAQGAVKPASAPVAEKATSSGILNSLDTEQKRYYNEGLNNGKNPDNIKGFHNGYVAKAKVLSEKYLNKPNSQELEEKEFDDAVDSFMDYEHKNSKSVNNYNGGGSNWGTNDPNIKTKEQAKKHYKEYWSRVIGFPPGLRTRAFQMAINTGDPYGEFMVAAGLMSTKERSETKANRKDLRPDDFNQEDKSKVNKMIETLKSTPAPKEDLRKKYNY